MALVDRKIRAGKTEEITEVEAPRESRRTADILDLSDLLKRSLGRGKGKPAADARKHAADDDDEAADTDAETAAPARKKPRAAGTSRSSGKSGGAGAKAAPAARKRRAAA
jgi:DNA end-binding protein Ku